MRARVLWIVGPGVPLLLSTACSEAVGEPHTEIRTSDDGGTPTDTDTTAPTPTTPGPTLSAPVGYPTAWEYSTICIADYEDDPDGCTQQDVPTAVHVFDCGSQPIDGGAWYACVLESVNGLAAEGWEIVHIAPFSFIDENAVYFLRRPKTESP